MQKYKKGDKVMVINTDHEYFKGDNTGRDVKIGQIFTIEAQGSEEAYYYLEETNSRGVDLQLNVDEFKIAEYPYNKLVVKLYPNGKKVGEKWLLQK